MIRPSRALRLLPAALLCIAAGNPEGVAPGAWERSVEFVSATQNGQPIPDFKTPEPNPDIVRRCVPPEVARDPGRMIFPPTKSGCRVLSQSLADGKARFTGECEDGGPQAILISGQGSYSRTAFDLDTTSEVPTSDKPIILQVKISARHVGECRKDDPPFDLAAES